MQKIGSSSIRVWLTSVVAMFFLSGCVVHPTHHRHVVVAKPVAKTVVVKPVVVVKKTVVVKKVRVYQ